MTAHPADQIVVRPMERRELPSVVDVLARAMLDNPSSIGMFGPATDRRLRSLHALYTMLLSELTQPPLVARSGGHVVGAAAVSPPGTCFYVRSQARVRRIRVAGRDMYIESPSVPWRHLPRLLSVGLQGLGRAAAMARLAAVHDPSKRHWHAELVGVAPEMQGQGIGRTLMDAALLQADEAGDLAYLETDTAENVVFYQRRGFQVAGEEKQLEVLTWYMERPPRAAFMA